MSLIEIIKGPLWYFASAVFVIGVLWTLIGLLRMKRPQDLSQARASGLSGAMSAVIRHSFPQKDIAPRMWLSVVAGYALHIGLFILLFFAAPHVDFIDNHLLGIGWTRAPHWLFIISAELAFAGLIILWIKRVMDPVLRLISSKGDHLGNAVLFIAMLTGCLAIGRGSEALAMLHLFTVELLMIYFPFSRMMHAFTFVFSRAETGMVYGRRGASL